MNESPNRSQQPEPNLPYNAKCLECNYALRGLPRNVCPECGHPFDPNRPLSYRVPILPGRLRLIGRPPTKRSHQILFVAALGMLIDLSSPGYGFPPGYGFAFVLLWIPAATVAVFLCAIAWTRRVIARMVVRYMPNPPAGHPIRDWLWMPIVFAILASAFIYPWPVLIRFHMSKSALEASITNLSVMQRWKPKYVGLFNIQDIETNASGTVFVETGSLVLDSAGFWYIPNGVLKPAGNDFTKRKLADNWYTGGQRF